MSDNIRHILIKYIIGHADTEEIDLVEKWISENKHNQRYYAQIYEEWHNTLASKHTLIDTDKAFERFLVETTKKNSFDLRKTYKYVAIFILVSLSSFFFYKLNQKPYKENVSNWEEIIVAKGETKKITLPDGTIVSINSDSQLRYNRDFGKHKRIVELNGEALFDIKNSKQQAPFIVKASGFVIEDIGTVFNVKAYSNDEDFETSVIEGEVSVEGKLSGTNSSKVFVSKNQAIKIKQKKTSIDKSAGNRRKTEKLVTPLQVIDIDPENMEQYSGWIKDVLIFENADFQKIANELERKFNVEIRFDDNALKHYHYTGTFKNAKDVYKILNIIKQTTPISYANRENKITIYNSKSKLTY